MTMPEENISLLGHKKLLGCICCNRPPPALSYSWQTTEKSGLQLLHYSPNMDVNTKNLKPSFKTLTYICLTKPAADTTEYQNPAVRRQRLFKTFQTVNHGT